MVKKSLFHSLLLTSFFAVLSTANAMDNNIEENKHILQLTAKQLKKGFKNGYIILHDNEYSVTSALEEKPDFDCIALKKTIQGTKREDGSFNFCYQKKDLPVVFNLNLTLIDNSNISSKITTKDNTTSKLFNFVSNNNENKPIAQKKESLENAKNIYRGSLKSITFASNDSIEDLVTEEDQKQTPYHFMAYKNLDGSVTFYRSTEAKRELCLMPIDQGLTLMCEIEKDKDSNKPKPLSLFKSGELQLTISAPVSNILFSKVRKLDCFLHLVKSHYNFKKKQAIVPNAKSLFEKIVNNPYLINRILKDNEYDEVRNQLAKFLSWNSSLNTYLRMNRNMFNYYLTNKLSNKSVEIFKYFCPTGVTFSSISTSNNELIGQFIKDKKITSLQIDKSKTPNVFTNIWNALDTYTSLEKMYLFDLNLNLEDVKKIAGILQKQNEMKELNLYHSNLKTSDGRMIWEAIKNKPLRALGFEESNFDDTLIGEICTDLQENKTLTYLDLSNTGVELQGVKAICELLKVNNTLKKLQLHKNNINDDGAKLLLEALKMNTSLEEIDVSYCKISEQLKSDIENILEKNQKK
jgi:hypothetical protein